MPRQRYISYKENWGHGQAAGDTAEAIVGRTNHAAEAARVKKALEEEEKAKKASEEEKKAEEAEEKNEPLPPLAGDTDQNWVWSSRKKRKM